VARPHPVLAGLPGPGVLDWDYYDKVVSHEMFQGALQPDEAIVAAFAVGYCLPGGYDSGINARCLSFRRRTTDPEHAGICWTNTRPLIAYS